MKVMRGDEVLVEDSTLERVLLRLEIAYPDVALYAHDDGSAIDMLVKDADGNWGEAEILPVAE